MIQEIIKILIEKLDNNSILLMGLLVVHAYTLCKISKHLEVINHELGIISESIKYATRKNDTTGN